MNDVTLVEVSSVWSALSSACAIGFCMGVLFLLIFRVVTEKKKDYIGIVFVVSLCVINTVTLILRLIEMELL